MKIEVIDSLGDDLTVVNSARVSFSKHRAYYNDTTDTKLIRYLAQNSHWTPFAHVQISCRVKIPIFMARQYFKHIVGSVKNEVSRRYVASDPEFWHPDSWRARPDNSIKQGSGEAVADQQKCQRLYESLIISADAIYAELLNQNVCPEQARAVLPQSMYTEFIDTGSLVYWSRIYKQRTHPGAQKEWTTLCKNIDKICRHVAPISWEALIYG